MYIPALRDFGRDRRANIGIMYALTLPVLMFVVGVAIDFGHAAQVAPSSTPRPTRQCSPP